MLCIPCLLKALKINIENWKMNEKLKFYAILCRKKERKSQLI